MNKAQVINQIKSNIYRRLGDECYTSSDELIEALAYACTFKNPRRFSTIEMSAQRWAELADTLTLVELANVSNSLVRFKQGGNRLFFILGSFARVYGQRKTCAVGTPANFQERHYTQAEIASVVTSIDDLLLDLI